jgi:hypothetical protein
MTYADFLRTQWQALVEEWLAEVNTAFIALPDLGWLEHLADPRRPGGGGGWSPLGDVAPGEALMRRDRQGRPQLWVKPEEKAGGSGRYAAHWARFCALLGMPAPASSLGGRALAVDHLFPETAAARRGWALVRAMPVDARSNSLVGSTIEKAEAGRGGRARPRTASSITLAKVTGFQGSFARSQAAGAVAQALLAHIRHCGLRVPPDAFLPSGEEEKLVEWLIGRYRDEP